ncbi:ester cyclase [Nostoc sp. TCL26-01]|uniref:ester cyclase n=1 Tax=Nostoc sp. TCL26-01 TaxID=2576904 RepID=UPI0015BDBED3|nr:ester cyclase [Nostoc sp. TCL26-01]QLE55988.1 ester cyclase [Nostoc sp. TCL26-01]
MNAINIAQLHLWVQDRDTVLEYSTHVEWRYAQKPDYSQIQEKLAQESTRNHLPNSLELLVQNLLQTFEIEANYKINPAQWLSVVPSQFRMSCNGGYRYTITDLINVGTYNLLIANTQHHKANNAEITTANNLLHTAFPDGLLWEVLEVYSQPPDIVLKWRHWGEFTGAYQDYAPTNKIIEVIGTSVLRVTDDFKIISLEHYYDHTQFWKQLTSGGKLLQTPQSEQQKRQKASVSIWQRLWGFISQLWRRKQHIPMTNI